MRNSTLLASVVLASAIMAALATKLPASAAEPVKIGEVVHLDTSVCMSLEDLMEVRAYALAHNGDGKTRYLQLKEEGKCMAFNTMELGMLAIIDEMVPGSLFTDSILGPTIFIRFHIDGMEDMPIYGIMGPEQLTLTEA